MTAGRRRVRHPAPAFAESDQVCRKSVEFGAREVRERERDDAGGVAASVERSWTGAAFAQERNAASPCPSASAGANSVIRIFVAGPTGVLIVEIDLTRIGPVSQTFPFGSDSARSAPPMVATRRTAHMTAAETADRSRMEFALRMRLSACVADSSDLQDRA